MTTRSTLGRLTPGFLPTPPIVVEATPMHWEYHQLVASMRDLPALEHLNALGAAGWMLVNTIVDTAEQRVTYLFMRRVA